MYTFEQIRAIILREQAEQGPLIQKMREILIRYDGDWTLPMPDLPNEQRYPQLTPALIGEAIDQIAMRAASVTPITSCPPIDGSKDRGKRSRQYGNIRTQILNATNEASRWQLGRRRYYRHLTAYHTASIVVVPDMKALMPRIEVRDPLGTYAEPRAAEELRDPMWAGFVSRMSGARLRAAYPACCSEYGGPITGRDTSRMWEVVEWYDQDNIVWGLMGPVDTWGDHVASMGVNVPANMELLRVTNRAGQVPVVVPHNVSLGRISARLSSLLGNVDLQAKLMGLHIAAQEKAIFPDVYVVGENNQTPELVNGEWKDGRTGEINMLKGVSTVGTLRTTPDPTTGQMIDRLERNYRTSTSLVPQLGGETYGALRTGRGIDALTGMALDPRVQELHEITEAHMPALNRAIFATYKGWWPSKQYSLYCGRAANRKLVEFTPEEHIETFESSTSYFTAGADAMQLTQILGSLRGAKAISHRTFQDSHPMIADSDIERAQTREEDLEEAVIQSVMQQIAAGQMPPTVAGMLHKHLKKGSSIFEAVEKVDKELKELQATQAPPPQDPNMIAPPEAMPGMTGGPTADQQPIQPTPPQIETPQGVSKMRELMAAMGG